MGIPFLGALTMSADYTNSQKPAALESELAGGEFGAISEALKAQIEANKS
jgi:hypothetical protein